MSWGEIFDKHEASRNRPAGDIDDNMEEEEEEEQEEGGRNDDLVGERDDSEGMYISPAERRNVNGRYPPLAREYGLVLKRYPLTKRSPKPLQNERQNARIVTDPKVLFWKKKEKQTRLSSIEICCKVAKDLGALFGGESAGEVKKNRTHDHRDKLQRESKAASMTLGESRLEVSSSVAPGSSVTPGQKEVTNKSIAKRDDGTIEAKKQKKSVDWSQYFGIDRRKKKATFLAKPGSQQQDDNWMLQRYYNVRILLEIKIFQHQRYYIFLVWRADDGRESKVSGIRFGEGEHQRETRKNWQARSNGREAQERQESHSAGRFEIRIGG